MVAVRSGCGLERLWYGIRLTVRNTCGTEPSVVRNSVNGTQRLRYGIRLTVRNSLVWNSCNCTERMRYGTVALRIRLTVRGLLLCRFWVAVRNVCGRSQLPDLLQQPGLPYLTVATMPSIVVTVIRCRQTQWLIYTTVATCKFRK